MSLLAPIDSRERELPDGALAVLFGADYSARSITPSWACRAPDAVRSALARFANYDAEHGTELPLGSVVDVGDAGCAHATDIERSSLDAQEWDATFSSLERHAASAFDLARAHDGAPAFAVGLGGDHSVTWPLLSAFARNHRRVGLVQLDAHHDVRSPAAGASNGTPVRGLVEQGVLDPSDIVQIGIHPFANRRELTDYCDAQGIVRFSTNEVRRVGMATVVESSLALLDECDAIYLTVDIDVLDRAHAPGTVAALPDGLTPQQLLTAVSIACTDPRTLAMDIVEFDPTRDIGSATAYNAALVMLHGLSAVRRRER